MQKIVFFLTALLVVNTAKAQPVATPKDLSGEQFLNLVHFYAVPVLVHLKADWCVVCKKESPLLQDFQKQHAAEIELLEIDLDENPKLGEYFEIDALPVHLLYYKGTLVWNKVGRIDFDQLENVLAVLKKENAKSKH